MLFGSFNVHSIHLGLRVNNTMKAVVEIALWKALKRSFIQSKHMVSYQAAEFTIHARISLCYEWIKHQHYMVLICKQIDACMDEKNNFNKLLLIAIQVDVLNWRKMGHKFTSMQAIKLLNTVYCRAPTNVVDYVDFWTFTKFVSPKINRNSIVTWIADWRKDYCFPKAT